MHFRIFMCHPPGLPGLAPTRTSPGRCPSPDLARQLASALGVQLTRAEKDALDLLAAWPRCSREQLAGLMGGVTLRRVNQALRPLRERDLVQEDESRLMLTDRGLTCLALTLDRWTAQPAVSDPRVYAGSALRAQASQPRHHGGVINFTASLTAKLDFTQNLGKV